MFSVYTTAHKGITQSLTKTFLEDAYKLKILYFSLEHLLEEWGHEHKDEKLFTR